MRLTLFLTFLCLLGVLPVEGQQFRFHQYRVEQGLPSDIIKAVTQDSLGFFWIATDDGLVKFDGFKFTPYKNAFRSQFVKGFLHTNDGRLLAFGDLDVIEINNAVDTVLFKSVLKGERFFSDSAIWFPKSIYQDRKSNIWLGEPKSLVKFSGGKITRYDLGEENRSPVFVRSFSFFEDDQDNLYAVSYPGNIFKYSEKENRFEQVKNIRLPTDVSQVLFYNSRLLVAARNGLFSCHFKENKFESVENIFPIRQVSNLLLTKDSTILVSTYEQDLYSIRMDPEIKWDHLTYKFNGINSTFVSKEKDVWVCTDKGLVLVQKNLFVLGDINSQAHFIEGIAYNKDLNSIYYCSKEKLVQLGYSKEGKWDGVTLNEDRNNYFQSLQYKGNRLWAATNWRVLVFENGRIIKTLDFSKEGNFVHDIFIDSKGIAWLSQAGSDKIKAVDHQFNIKAFLVDDVKRNEINVIREGAAGMYGVGSGTDTYLYFKSNSDDSFRNISVGFSFPIRGDFNVQDIAVSKGDVLWLATTEGLLKYKDKKIERIAFGEEFEQYPVSSVEILNDQNILFSNSFGLFRLNTITNEYWLYDENTGLPSNSVTDHGIFVTDDEKVWIGTSFGLAYAAGSLTENKITNSPHCVEARVNGNPVRFRDGVKAEYGSFITLRFSPVSFPENRITLQWRSADEKSWKTIENQQLSFSNLSEGSHSVFVRAKKNTGYSWSKPATIMLTIEAPYWKTTQFIFLVILLVVLIAWASYAISAAFMSQRKEYLQQQIRERTQELQKANEELLVRNTELDRFVYSASHDLSAPLKSILGLIRVAQMDQPGETHAQYLQMMERSVNKLEAFIQEVVTYSRNTRMPLKYDSFNFKDFVKGLLQDHEFSPNFNLINFEIEDHLKGNMISDVTRIKIILNNLLSNAIKFHSVDDGREAVVKISISQEAGNYILKVVDNGPGISEEHLERVFEMFYRATDGTQGSGLGLYILKESVLKLGGTVQAFSKVGEGTTFIIALPVPDQKNKQ